MPLRLCADVRDVGWLVDTDMPTICADSGLVLRCRFSSAGSVDSPFARSPAGSDLGMLGAPTLSPKHAPRKIPRSPFKARYFSVACRARALHHPHS